MNEADDCKDKVMHVKRNDLWVAVRKSSWSRKENNRRGASAAVSLNRSQLTLIYGLNGSEKFVCEWQVLVFDALINFKPVKKENLQQEWYESV